MKPRIDRRRFLATSIATATALQFAPDLFAETTATCKVNAEQEVGPFYVADELVRSSIAEDRPGTPLHLTLRLLDTRTCKPLSNAAVDLWHCDAAGLYSGYTKTSLGPPPGGDFRGGPPPGDHNGPPTGPPPDGFPGGPEGPSGPGGMKPSDKLTFCRGIQLTDSAGNVNFQTIFPGFYQGRVNHIHMKIRIGGTRNGLHYAAGHTAHTGQIFFPEDLTTAIMAREPYSAHHIHRTTMAEDMVYNGQHGEAAIAALTHLAKGYRAVITVAVDPTATPKPVGPGGPRA